MDRERRLATQRAISAVLARANGLAEVAPRLLEAIGRAEGWPVGLYWELDRSADVLSCRALWHEPGVPEETVSAARNALPPGMGLPGRAWKSGAPVCDAEGCAFPIRDGGQVLGILEFRVPATSPVAADTLGRIEEIERQLADALARRRAEGAVERLEGRLHLIVQHAPLVVFMFDREHRLTRVEGRGLEPLGLRTADLIGRKNDELWPDSHIPENTRRALAGEEFADLVEVPGPRFYDTRYLPQRDASGEVVEVIGVATDVTERILAERRMIEADRLAALGTLAAGVAHEINNPLTYALLNLSMIARHVERLAEVPIRDKLVELLRETQTGVERVARVVQDLSTLSRSDPEGGGPLDVVKLLEAVAGTMGGLIRRHARFRTDYAPTPPVDASPARLSQVFLNLLLWSAHHVGGGLAEEQEVQVRTLTDAQGRAVVMIGSTGPGLAPEEARRVFEPYFGGAGLGLSICRAVVTRLSGEIAVDTALGRGTTFLVTLPAAAAEPKPATSAQAPSRPRVLVVDDEAVLVRAIAEALRPDYDVEALTGGGAALERLGEADVDFDLILCDLIMPIVNGIQVHAAVRERRPDLADRMLFMSGGSITPEVTAFVDEMQGRILEKPFDLSRLLAVVRERLVTR